MVRKGIPEFIAPASAREMAWSRELLGVHYPSDSEAGRLFAQDFVRLLFESPAFRKDLAGVVEEWSGVGVGFSGA